MGVVVGWGWGGGGGGVGVGLRWWGGDGVEVVRGMEVVRGWRW